MLRKPNQKNQNAWKFNNLEKDPKELTNSIDDEAYTDAVQMMHKMLDSVQKVYKVTDREFEQAPKEAVERANKMFDKLKGTPIRKLRIAL